MEELSVVVPVYFNVETLEALASRLTAVAEQTGGRWEFVFVDDGSRDASRSVLRTLAQRDHRFRIVELSRNFGSNAAILAGLTYARGQCAVVLSADLQDPPELIARMVELWRQGRRIVMAARRTRSDPLVARLFGSAFNWLFRQFVFREFPRRGFDVVLLDRRVIDILVSQQEKNSYLFGQVMWVGFTRAVVEYDREPRRHGRSHWTTAKKIKYFVDAFSAFSYLPLRVTSVLGMVLAVLGFLYALLVVFLRLTQQVPITGWSSLTVVVLVTSGTQLLMLGVLGEYLWRALDEVRRRPPYIVENLVNIAPEDAINRPESAPVPVA